MRTYFEVFKQVKDDEWEYLHTFTTEKLAEMWIVKELEKSQEDQEYRIDECMVSE